MSFSVRTKGNGFIPTETANRTQPAVTTTDMCNSDFCHFDSPRNNISDNPSHKPSSLRSLLLIFIGMALVLTLNGLVDKAIQFLILDWASTPTSDQSQVNNVPCDVTINKMSPTIKLLIIGGFVDNRKKTQSVSLLSSTLTHRRMKWITSPYNTNVRTTNSSHH